MEKFKLVEKSYKIKAFSNEGLSLQERSDPEMEEREKMIEWLSETIKDLELQCDTFETELEGMKALLKKGKHSDASRAKKMARISWRIDRHKWHIYMLESIMCLLSKEELEVGNVMEMHRD